MIARERRLAERLAFSVMERTYPDFKVVEISDGIIHAVFNGVCEAFDYNEFIAATLVNYGGEISPVAERAQITITPENEISVDRGYIRTYYTPEEAIAIGVAGKSADLTALVNVVKP